MTYSDAGALEDLIAEARRHPLLGAEEELRFARAWRDEQDQASLTRLIGSHLRLVIKIARSYTGYGLPLSDLVAEGNVGLMQAANKFDPERGFRFATYAHWWIRAAIQDYVLHSWSIVRGVTTSAQKKLFFNLRRLKNKLKAYEDGDLSPELAGEIAKTLDVSSSEVVDMNRRLSRPDRSLNAPFGIDGDGTWMDILEDERPSQEDHLLDRDEMSKRSVIVREAIEKLPERERHILEERKMRDDPKTLQALCEVYDISRERVRQIEGAALRKIGRHVSQRLQESAEKRERALQIYFENNENVRNSFY